MNLKWLSISEGVVLTPAIERSINASDIYFEGIPSVVTSGKRTAEHQLSIIYQKAKTHDIEKMFPEFLQYKGSPINTKVNDLYYWQPTWAHLLQIGDLVNPPLPAVSVSDYKRGQTIDISDHMRGIAWDVGGGSNLTERAKRIMHAVGEGKCFISNFKIERINNAVHVDCVPM